MRDIIILIIIIFVIVQFVKHPHVRYTFRHPYKVIKTAFNDLYIYIKHKKYNECKEFGKIKMLTASGSQVFGCGKTLTAVARINQIYNRYNNKPVWSDEKGEFVIQHINVVSNVDLKGIPYYHWVGEQQFTQFERFGFEEQDVTIFLLDEAGAVFNSRKFKENISMEFLTKLLQSRKNKMSLYLTSQRFGFTDKILRESCSTVTACKKIWRFVILNEYDAYSVERCDNLQMIQPISSKVWFATNNDYALYDTSQLVEKLKKIEEEGGFLSTEEILATRGDNVVDVNLVQNKLRQRFRRRK